MSGSERSVGLRIWHAYVRVLQVVCGALMVWIVGVTLVNVFTRYFLARSIVWADETARLSFVVFTFMAMALAGAANRHLSVDALVQRFGPRVRAVVNVLVPVVTLLFCAVLVWGGYRVTTANLGQSSPALRLPMWWVYASVPVGALLLAISTLGALWYGPTGDVPEEEAADLASSGEETRA